MVAVYEQAIGDKKANRIVEVDTDKVKAKLKERRESGYRATARKTAESVSPGF